MSDTHDNREGRATGAGAPGGLALDAPQPAVNSNLTSDWHPWSRYASSYFSGSCSDADPDGRAWLLPHEVAGLPPPTWCLLRLGLNHGELEPGRE